MAVNDRLNMVVVLTKVFENDSNMEKTLLPYFDFSHSRRRCFLIYLLTIQWQAAEINVIFNEMLFEQSVTSFTNNECPPISGKMDFVGLIKLR